MRSFHKEIKPGNVVSAFKKSSDSGLDIVEVDYETITDGVSKYYRTGMTIDTQKYDFKEVSFGEITKNDVRRAQSDIKDITTKKI